MSDNLKAMQECGLLPEGEIPTNPVEMFVDHQELKERLEEYTSRILASQQAAHEAEIAKLKEENQRVKTDSIMVVETLKADLAAANAACAMKDEALTYAIEDLTLRAKLSDDDSLNIGQGALYKMHEALSASTQQVSEWERKQLEPLRAQVAMLRDESKRLRRGLADIANMTENNKIILAVANLIADTHALSNTQAAAEQLIAECEQRGAIKALEEAALLADNVGGNLADSTFTGLAKEFRRQAEAIRATSKKAE